MAEIKRLDAKGRCCGRKPIVYKRPHYLFCHRCEAAFTPDGVQTENWCYEPVEGGFRRAVRAG